jgi:hypothetical protein
VVRIPLDKNRRLRYLSATLLFLVAGMMLVGSDLDSRVLGSIALLASLAMFAWRHFLEIDAGKGRLARRVGLLYPFVRASFHVDSFRCLALTAETRTDSKGRETTDYFIRIGGMGGGKLCQQGDMWALRHVTERLCRELGVDMENRLLGGASTRKATDLDVSLAERWRQAGIHKEAPRLATDSVARIEHTDTYSEFSVPVQPMPRTAIGIGGAVILAGLIALYRFTEFPLLGLLVFGGAVLFFAIGFILQHSGRNRVRFTADEVAFHRGKFSRRAIAIAGIEEILANNEELALMSDRDYLVMDQPSDPNDARAQREFIERQIAQRQTQASTTPA